MTDHTDATTVPFAMRGRLPARLPDRIRHDIGGKSVDSVGGETFDVLDPVTNGVYLRAAAGKKADVDLDGDPQPVVERTDSSELAVTIGADGFSYTRSGEQMPAWKQGEYKLGHQL